MQSIYILLRNAVGGAVRKLWTKTAATAQAAQPSNALLPSRHTWVDLQDRHTRSPDQELSKPWPHFKHFRTLFSYSRSEVGREYFLLSSIAFNVARKQTPNYTNSRPIRFADSAGLPCRFVRCTQRMHGTRLIGHRRAEQPRSLHGPPSHPR